MIKQFIAFMVTVLALAAGMFVFIPQAQAQVYCYGALPARLYVGVQGQVTPGLPNTLRSQPYQGGDSLVLGQIPAGGVFTVIGGPSCYNSMYWWQVNYNGTMGWTPEAGGGVYWVQPVSVDAGCMALPSRLSAGQYGRVTYGGMPNVLRTQPNRSYTSSIIANIPAGDTFYIISGPTCGEGITWWQVNYSGLTGWTAEGYGSQYWLESLSSPPPPGGCPMLPSRMLSGYTGIVTPGLPNRLRTNPSLSGQVMANMPAGATFLVISGPSCVDNTYWWQVNYRGTVGWTAEGQGGRTYIEPLSCPGFQTSRISSGRQARVTPGLPNRLRSSATTGAAVLGQIPSGATFSVIGGPICSENAAWWRVNYLGLVGWTMEGQYAQYWLEPA